jgi:lysophospholipase L1-like esterase
LKSSTKGILVQNRRDNERCCGFFFMARRVALSLCAVIVMLFLLEGIVRYFKLAPVIFDYKIFEPMQFVENPRICYKMKPFGACEGGFLNSDGFKDGEFAIHKDDNLIRIAMLGDSITKGTGVPLGQTFSDQLEDMLNRKSKASNSGIRYEVMNFGVGGYNIESEMEILKVYALKYKPDVVVLNYFFNDDEEYSFNYWFFLDKHDSTTAEKNLVYQYYLRSNTFSLQRALLHSRLYTFCLVRINNVLRLWANVKSDHADRRAGVIREKLGELKELSRKRDFKALVCMHPTLDYDAVMPDPGYDATARIARALDIPCLDLSRAYRDRSRDPRVFLSNPDDKAHPNAEGHKLIAATILDELKAAGWYN